MGSSSIRLSVVALDCAGWPRLHRNRRCLEFELKDVRQGDGKFVVCGHAARGAIIRNHSSCNDAFGVYACMRARHAVSHFSGTCDVALVGLLGVGLLGGITRGRGNYSGSRLGQRVLYLFVRVFERSVAWNFVETLLFLHMR